MEASSKGFDIDEAISLVRLTRGMNVIGGDIVCMMPTKDSPNNITAHTAMAIMFEMICVMAEKQETSKMKSFFVFFKNLTNYISKQIRRL